MYMETPILEQTAFRIGEHAAAHRLAHVRIIAHGGEPLLALTKDPDYYSRYAEILHKHIDPSGTKVHLFMQTNGLLLNDRKGPQIINQLKAAGFNIGLSIDGNQAANDLHRRDKAGRSTHSRAERAAQLLVEHEADWGVLGVIDPRTNPEETVEYLASLKPQAINLFPMHAHNSDPPVKHPGAIALGEWQKRALDHYIDWAKNHPGTDAPPFEMPIYDNYLRMAFGAPSLNDTAGARTTQELFITPSGKWERLDTLKSADDGAVFTGLNIFEHSLDDVRRDPGIVARRMGFTALAPACQGCDLLNLCFGNHYPNRYKRPEEPLTPQSSVEEFVEAFRNPSAHCEDHKTFLGHVKKLVNDTAKQSEPANIEQNTLMDIPSDVSELDPQTQLDKLLLPFRIAAHKQYTRHQAQANYIDINTVAAPRFAHDSTSQRHSFTINEANGLHKAIKRGDLTGRAALEHLQLLVSQYEKEAIVFSSLGQDNYVASELHAMLSVDYNDTIVNTMLELTAASGQKIGGYWFVERAFVDKLIEDPYISGYIAAVHQDPSWPSSSFFNGDCGIDYWQIITPYHVFSTTSVTALDLPGDVLVVDTVNHDATEIIGVIDEIKTTYGDYLNVQELAAAMRRNGVHLEPLIGTWPDDTRWTKAANRALPESNPPSELGHWRGSLHSDGAYGAAYPNTYTRKEKAFLRARAADPE